MFKRFQNWYRGLNQWEKVKADWDIAIAILDIIGIIIILIV